MINSAALQKSARMLAQRAGMTVQFSNVMSPCTDGRTLYLPTPVFNWTAAEAQQWRNSAGHEIGHNMPVNRDVFALLEETKLTIQHVPGLVLNAIDDVRNDRNRLAVYPGMVDPWVIAQVHYQNLAVERINDIQPGSIADTAENRILITMLVSMGAAAVRGRTPKQQQTLLNAFQSTVARADQTVQTWVDAIMSRHIETWRNLETASDEYQFMRVLLADVFNLPESEIPPENMADCAEWAEDKYGDDPGQAGAGHFTIKFDDLIDDHDARRDPERRQSSTIDYTSYTNHETANPHTVDSTQIVTEPGGMLHEWFADRTQQALEKSDIKSMRKRATRYLHAVVQKQYRTNQKKGRFDSRKVFKLADKNTKEPLIYKTTQQNEKIHTAVSILVDASASMHGDKQYLATVAAIGMAELCQASRAAFEIAFFSDLGKNHHWIAKDFSKTYNEGALIHMADTAFDKGCVNADADSLLLAYSRLAARSETRKILIVMSDGSPSSTNGGGNPLAYAQRVAHHIETKTPVDLIGVGICDDNVKQIYSNNRVCRTVEHLPGVLLGILKNTITIKD